MESIDRDSRERERRHREIEQERYGEKGNIKKQREEEIERKKNRNRNALFWRISLYQYTGIRLMTKIEIVLKRVKRSTVHVMHCFGGFRCTSILV